MRKADLTVVLPVSCDLLRWHESLTIKPQIHTFTFAQHNKSKAFSWLLGKFSDNLTPKGVSKLVYEERELVYETDLFPEDTLGTVYLVGLQIQQERVL